MKRTPSIRAETTNYRELAVAMRGLVPAMKHQETRGDLQRLAADYDRLAEFAESRRSSARVEKRRATLATFAVLHPNVKALIDELDEAVTDALRLRVQFIRTELELGFTFLDCARDAAETTHSQRSIRNALLALGAANRFLASDPQLSDIDRDKIYQRREELRQRLREILRAH